MVKTPIDTDARSTIGLRPYRSDSRPQTGAANAAMNDVVDASPPAHRSISVIVLTPTSGRNSGMIGLRIENENDITSCTDTIAHSVTRHRGEISASSSGNGSVCAGIAPIILAAVQRSRITAPPRRVKPDHTR